MPVAGVVLRAVKTFAHVRVLLPQRRRLRRELGTAATPREEGEEQREQ